MTRAPLRRALVGGGDGDRGSSLTKEPPDGDACLRLDPDEEEEGAILRGVQKLPCRRDMVAVCGGSIVRGRLFPPPQCAPGRSPASCSAHPRTGGGLRRCCEQGPEEGRRR